MNNNNKWIALLLNCLILNACEQNYSIAAVPGEVIKAPVDSTNKRDDGDKIVGGEQNDGDEGGGDEGGGDDSGGDDSGGDDSGANPLPMVCGQPSSFYIGKTPKLEVKQVGTNLVLYGKGGAEVYSRIPAASVVATDSSDEATCAANNNNGVVAGTRISLSIKNTGNAPLEFKPLTSFTEIDFKLHPISGDTFGGRYPFLLFDSSYSKGDYDPVSNILCPEKAFVLSYIVSRCRKISNLEQTLHSFGKLELHIQNNDPSFYNASTDSWKHFHFRVELKVQ